MFFHRKVFMLTAQIVIVFVVICLQSTPVHWESKFFVMHYLLNPFGTAFIIVILAKIIHWATNQGQLAKVSHYLCFEESKIHYQFWLNFVRRATIEPLDYSASEPYRLSNCSVHRNDHCLNKNKNAVYYCFINCLIHFFHFCL